MAESTTDRKQEILEAALAEFSKRGSEGARMQSIADHIGVTKAMIYYYFDTKENLSEAVFIRAYENIMSHLLDILETDDDLFLKIERFVGEAIERFHSEPMLVNFIVNELNRNPDKTAALLQEQLRFDRTVLEEQLSKAASNYEIAAVSSDQLLVNMLSLCMFPYVGRTFLKNILDFGDQEAYTEFLNQRKKNVADVIMTWLTS